MWLDFSKGLINLKFIENKITKNWQIPILNLIKSWYDNNNTLLISTSGTTSGKSVFFSVKKKFFINSVINTKKFFNIKKGQKSLLCLSTDFIAGKMVLIRAIVLKLKLYCVFPSSSPINNIDYFFDFVSMVPLQVFNSINYLFRIKILLIGGGKISLELNNILKKISTNCYASYGLTETLGHIALKKINNNDNKINYFKSLPGIKLKCNKNKCLIIYAPSINKKKIYTNDIVKFYSHNEFEWLGRYDNLINSGGIKIIPEIIEEKISLYIKKPFFIAGIPDKLLGQRIVLFIEDNKKQNFSKNIFLNLKNIYRPKNIFFISVFSKTKSGKINRNKVIKKFLKKYSSIKKYD